MGIVVGIVASPDIRRRRCIMKRPLILIAIACGFWSDVSGRPCRGEPDDPPLSLLVPAYIWPGGKQLKDWDRLIAAADRVPITAIVNKDSGPGKQVDRDFRALLERARRSKLTLVGYVPLKYAKRPVADVKADVDRWLSLYPGMLSGIMFDEQPSGPEGVPYLTECAAYVRSRIKNARIVSNPGTTCAPEYFAIDGAPTICMYESKTGINAYRPPSWRTTMHPTQMAVLLYDVSTKNEMWRSLRVMARKRAGFVYITDDSGANPWDRLPSYWDEEVAAVEAANRRAAGSPKK
jgi:hypothetical protein